MTKRKKIIWSAVALILVIVAIRFFEPPRLDPKELPDGLSFCSFGPKLTVVDPFYEEKCRGTAKVQGVMWRCTQLEKVERITDEYHERLSREAKARCQRHCSQRASKCEGIYDPSHRCGLSVAPEDAENTGERLGCRDTCTGKAFVYCSLYASGFISADPKQMAKHKPNCFCRPRD